MLHHFSLAHASIMQRPGARVNPLAARRVQALQENERTRLEIFERLAGGFVARVSGDHLLRFPSRLPHDDGGERTGPCHAHGHADVSGVARPQLGGFGERRDPARDGAVGTAEDAMLRVAAGKAGELVEVLHGGRRDRNGGALAFLVRLGAPDGDAA